MLNSVTTLFSFYSQLDISNDEKDEREIILKKRWEISSRSMCLCRFRSSAYLYSSWFLLSLLYVWLSISYLLSLSFSLYLRLSPSIYLFSSYSLIFFLSPLQLYRAHAVHRGNLYVRLDRRFKNEILHRSSHYIARGKSSLSLLFYFHLSSYVLLFALFSLS